MARWRQAVELGMSDEEMDADTVVRIPVIALRACDDPGAVAGATRAYLDRVRLAENDTLAGTNGVISGQFTLLTY
jgi:hypothetical protein